MRIAIKLSCLAAAMVLAGCSSMSSWNPFASKTDAKNPPSPLVEFQPVRSVATTWTANIGKAGNFSFSPAIAGSSVYAAAADGTLARLDVVSGRQVWRINAGMPLTAGVGTDGQTVAVAGEKGQLLAYDADGKQIWKAQASSEILSAPAVGQGVVVIRSVDNKLAAYDAATGARRWVTQRTAPPLTLRTAPGIVISGQTAYVAMPGGRLLALSVANGGPRWEMAVGDPRGTTELERVADVSGRPAIIAGDVCAAAYQGRIACFDANTGAPRWAKDFSSDTGVAADERFVYAGDDKGNVSALSRDTGTSAWRNNKLVNRRLSSPAAVANMVAVGDYEGYVHFLNRDDGAFVARARTDGSSLAAAMPVVDGKTVFFQTKDGTVVALTAAQ
ncbi:outer membrane protein assembly factor BamB [Noviherbaspirillum galbum]|uniref:Outer membrane protein assembly factor BamB n=1 Tax=Noviherbaspirillum galbum TaxID=2709383 RepID=A0A6B3SW71_9BURK|nr:outer membrane protein assembly factor BamB [Noviherbaspirillum galbum]NEX62622.1 outer membrane protein assembly factor BamB [Noviherbaspirillum galbum]